MTATVSLLVRFLRPPEVAEVSNPWCRHSVVLAQRGFASWRLIHRLRASRLPTCSEWSNNVAKQLLIPWVLEGLSTSHLDGEGGAAPETYLEESKGWDVQMRHARLKGQVEWACVSKLSGTMKDWNRKWDFKNIQLHIFFFYEDFWWRTICTSKNQKKQIIPNLATST